MQPKTIPVTVLTGYLGSGKTTLLNRILSEQHGLRIAVIENEFGEIGIDQALVINADEEVFEMNNGCICCTVRGDLIRILGNLAKRRDRFDRIVVETTGMADPGPVAQTFFVDDEIRELYHLDGIVTLVDCKHVELHLDDSRECQEQVAFADVLVLNKTDLVETAEVDRLDRRLRSMNGMARVLRARNADLPLAAVLDVGGFDLDRAVAQRPSFLEPEYPFEWAGTYELAPGAYAWTLQSGPDPTLDLLCIRLEAGEWADDAAALKRAERLWQVSTPTHAPGMAVPVERTARLDTSGAATSVFPLPIDSAARYALYSQHRPVEFSARLQRDGVDVVPLAGREFAAAHVHDVTVTSVGLHMPGSLDGERLNRWLSELLRDKGADIYRMKGILSLHDSDKRYVFQGVHMLFDGREDRPWGKDERASDLVFIGRDLDRQALERGFHACRA